jgi:hypothetical protein
MCGTAFTHHHHVNNGTFHDKMRSAQVSQPGTHTAIDIQNAIDPITEKLSFIRANSDSPNLGGASREELFSAIEEARGLVNSIATALEIYIGTQPEQAEAVQSAAS